MGFLEREAEREARDIGRTALRAAIWQTVRRSRSPFVTAGAIALVAFVVLFLLHFGG